MPIYLWILVLTGVLGMPITTGAVLARADRAVGVRVAAGLLAWTAVSTGLALSGVYESGRVFAGSLMPAAFLVGLLGMLAATRTPALARVLDSPGMVPRLAYPQMFRVAGVVFLIGLALGRVPAAFALPAGLGDIAVGLSAYFVARRGRTALRRFSYAGIADLVVALTIGALTVPGTIRLAGLGPANTAVTELPLVLIPTAAVPLALVLHFAVLRRTRTASAAPQPVSQNI